MQRSESMQSHHSDDEYMGLLLFSCSVRVPSEWDFDLFRNRDLQGDEAEQCVDDLLKRIFGEAIRDSGCEFALENFGQIFEGFLKPAGNSGYYQIGECDYGFPSELLQFPRELQDCRDQKAFNQVLNARTDSNRTYYREFILHANYSCPPIGEAKLESSNSAPQEYTRQYDAVKQLCWILACRRTQLFAPNFSLRVYNIFFPPIEMVSENHPERGYFGLPLLTLYRKPNSASFRQTLSFSFILVPESVKKLPGEDSSFRLESPRVVKAQEISELTSQTQQHFGYRVKNPPRYIGEGPLVQWLEAKNPFTIDGLFDELLVQICKLARGKGKSLDTASVHDSIQRSMQNSSVHYGSFIAFYPVPDGSRFPWDKWLEGKADQNLQQRLAEIATWHDSSNVSDYAKEVGLKGLLISNEVAKNLATTPVWLTFHNHRLKWLLDVLPISMEEYPRRSVKWMFAWMFHQCVALSALKEMSYAFYHEVETKDDLSSMLDTAEEFVNEFDELYDIDLDAPFYKAQYELIRKRAGLDEDCRNLKEKIDALREQTYIKAAHTLNILIVILMVVSAAVSVTVAFSNTSFGFAGSLILVGVAVVIGYYVIKGNHGVKM